MRKDWYGRGSISALGPQTRNEKKNASPEKPGELPKRDGEYGLERDDWRGNRLWKKGK